MNITTPVDKRHRVRGLHSVLLVLATRVHLNEELQQPPLSFHFRPDGRRNLISIDRVNIIEHSNGISGLIRLQGANKMKPDIRIYLAECRPLRNGFLYPVLPKVSLASHQQRRDGIASECLGYRDKTHAARLAASRIGRTFDRSSDIGEIFGWIVHGSGLCGPCGIVKRGERT